MVAAKFGGEMAQLLGQLGLDESNLDPAVLRFLAHSRTDYETMTAFTGNEIPETSAGTHNRFEAEEMPSQHGLPVRSEVA